MGKGCPLNVNHEVNSLVTIPNPEIQLKESDVYLTQAGTSPNNLGNKGLELLCGHTVHPSTSAPAVLSLEWDSSGTDQGFGPSL